MRLLDAALRAIRWIRPAVKPAPIIFFRLNAPQSLALDDSARSARRVILRMQQEQYAIDGWCYARRFRN